MDPQQDPYAPIAKPISNASADPYAPIAKPVTATAPPQNPAPFKTSVDDADQKKLDVIANAGSAVPYSGEIIGGVKSFLQPAVTIAKLLHKGGEAIHKGLGEAVVPSEGLSRFEHGTETQSPQEATGEAMETIAEFALGDEALKTMTLPQKLSKVAPLLKALEKSPKMVKTLAEAIRQGGVAGVQGLAHGEEAGTAAEQGVLTTGGTLAFGGLSRGASALLKRYGSTLEKIGGVDTVIPAEARNVKPTGQQVAGQEAIKNAAQSTLAEHLEDVNRSRAIPESPRMLPPRTGPYEFQIRGLEPTQAEHGSSAVEAAKLPRKNIVDYPAGQTPSAQSELDAYVRSLQESGMEDRVEAREPGKTTINASGESSSSFEAQQRLRNEQARGLQRYRIDTRTGNSVPLTGVDAVDATAGPHDAIVIRDAAGNESLIDAGDKARYRGSNTARNSREIGSSSQTVPARVAREDAFATGAAPGAEPHTVEPPKGGGVIKTQDPDLVKRHLGALNEIISHDDFAKLSPAQKQAVLGAREDIQRQLGEFYEHQRINQPNYNKPNFPQIDVPRTVKQIGSYTEAATHLEKIATDGYNSISDALQLNDISGGKFATIRNANRAAWDAYKGASTVEAMGAAERAIDETNRQMTELLSRDIGGAVSPEELDGFNRAYRNSQKLKYIAHAVDSSFSGNASASARSWEYRGFDGNKLMGNLNRLEQKFGRNSLESAIGKDNLNTLYQVAGLNRTNAARGKFGAAIQPIVEWMDRAGGAFSHLAPIVVGGETARAAGVPWGVGAMAGEAAALATKKVLNAILSNPKIAQNLIFAIDSGARPQFYGPMIGAMIQRAERSHDDVVSASDSKLQDYKDSKKEDNQ